jgi:hypothetical protein
MLVVRRDVGRESVTKEWIGQGGEREGAVIGGGALDFDGAAWRAGLVLSMVGWGCTAPVSACAVCIGNCLVCAFVALVAGEAQTQVCMALGITGVCVSSRHFARLQVAETAIIAGFRVVRFVCCRFRRISVTIHAAVLRCCVPGFFSSVLQVIIREQATDI